MAAAVRKAVAEYNESNSRNVNDNYDPFWPGTCVCMCVGGFGTVEFCWWLVMGGVWIHHPV